MNFEKTTIILLFISFLLGLSILVYFLYLSTPIALVPSNVSEEYLGKRILITGKIVNIIKREKVNYLIISDEIKNFTIVIFPDVFRFIENKIKKDEKVEIIGILSLYKGNLQIILQNPNNLKIRND